MLLTIYIDEQLVKRIDRLRAVEDVSRSRFVEGVLASAIEHEEATIRTMTDPVAGPAILKAMASPEMIRGLWSVIRNDLTDEQLKLFEQSMQAAAEHMQKRAGRAGAKHTPTSGRVDVSSKPRQKGHKSGSTNK